MVKDVRLKLRRVRDAAASKWGAWRGVRMFGYVEVGAVRESDIRLLLPGVKEAILAAPVDGRLDTDPVWLPHLHLIGFSYAKVRKMPRPDAAAQGCLRSFRMRSGGKYR